jgi:hypothetical protein
MLKHLKRWLGWESESDLLDLAGASSRAQSVPPVPKPPVAVQTRSIAQAPAAPKPAPTERAPLDVLDDPRLTLDKPPDDGFDPYNTGAFNRSTSWERIGRQRKR